jgi:hypothetical protein
MYRSPSEAPDCVLMPLFPLFMCLLDRTFVLSVSNGGAQSLSRAVRRYSRQLNSGCTVGQVTAMRLALYDCKNETKNGELKGGGYERRLAAR